jgi:hypothetical protein
MGEQPRFDTKGSDRRTEDVHEQGGAVWLGSPAIVNFDDLQNNPTGRHSNLGPTTGILLNTSHLIRDYRCRQSIPFVFQANIYLFSGILAQPSAIFGFVLG